ncbi:MAG TPA: chemotaxis protein CheW [Treponemataceae bacterium]|nr:purine-binding chemotaxis protein CheW [Treponema sp.]OQB03735.1 MAG: Chemotaxis protein CheW [Spirochaetes bacterium ADurb.Bin215]HOS36408.1 chemotaxis protein CheW [Treponemataceae bacterium]HPA10030.1 chemotaxis protein CheW [Treponemataceae bacterium]HPL90525.1 chemotaxis protein CheW [Treponemataceae bacterium]
MEKKDTPEAAQFLTFFLGDERYAIDVRKIHEVLEVPRITRVPRMPAFVSGVMNLRGNVIPVMDLRHKFGLGKTEITEDTSIVVTEISDVFGDEEQSVLEIGLFSDAVDQVLDIPPENIEPPPAIGTSIDTSFIRGMGRVGDDFVIILKLDSLLSEKELLGQDTYGGSEE